MRENAVLLESLFLIRIGNKDPGKHFLAEQRLVGASTEPSPSAESAQRRQRHVFQRQQSVSSVLGLHC
jgi:hypothetical protein